MDTFTVCIPAAGIGRRMGSAMPKQYLPLLGRPVLLHTIAAFDAVEECAEIILAVEEEEVAREMLGDLPTRAPLRLVRGGARRQDSVENAVAAVEDDNMIVLVHDAARPCITAAQIRAVAAAAREHGAALLALPARDTMKEVHAGVVRATLDRSVIWQAQTPQAARAGLLRIAFAEAARRGIEATDDVSLLEAIDVPVHVVEGSATNLKITTPEDMVMAEAILSARTSKGASR